MIVMLVVLLVAAALVVVVVGNHRIIEDETKVPLLMSGRNYRRSIILNKRRNARTNDRTSRGDYN
jgi:hypothetical protein